MVSPIMIAATAGITALAWVLLIRVAMTEGGTSGGFQTEEELLMEESWGVALTDLEPTGKVRISNKEWTASADPGVLIRAGDEVRVIGVYGQVVKVERRYQD